MQRDPEVPLMPAALRERLLPLLGDEVHALEKALDTPSPVSIRLNPFKRSSPDAVQVPWCANGRYLDERPAFTFDPLLHAGAYYVQEAASMLLEQAVIASGVRERDILALDLCAAPGGKSTHLISLLTEGSLLVANEPDGARRHVLAENMWKHGAGNVVMTGSGPSALTSLPSFFDLTLVDAPCSGEGMFRKDAFARRQWSPALVAACAATQREIVAHAWEALTPGGTLIYSTCTWEPEENEAQLLPLLAQGGACLELPLVQEWGVVRSDVGGAIGYRCYPHRVKGEGFFIAAVRKADGARSRVHGTERPGKDVTVPAWIGPGSDMAILEHHDVLHAVPRVWSSHVEMILKAMRTHAPGIPFSERKGDTWVPHAAAALSRWLDRSVFPEIALDGAQAIAYLRGGATPATGARGTALVTHQGLPLGWVHGAGGRWNNRWPAPWRIRGQRSQAPDVPWAMHAGPGA